jgi:rhodanese-related sulfurtransferase
MKLDEHKTDLKTAPRKGRRWRWVLWAALLAIGCEQAWRHGHDYIFAEEFRVVEPGKIYRGAWQREWPMRRIVRDRKIKTILALAHNPGDPLAISEEKLARDLGVRWIHAPIVEEWVDGRQQTVGDAIERAAGELADPKNQPVYFHCHHGVNRASLVQMAYRMLYCGWDLDQATEEIKNTVGLIPVRHGVDYRYMAQFYNERVLPKRRANALKTSKAVAR